MRYSHEYNKIYNVCFYRELGILFMGGILYFLYNLFKEMVRRKGF